MGQLQKATKKLIQHQVGQNIPGSPEQLKTVFVDSFKLYLKQREKTVEGGRSLPSKKKTEKTRAGSNASKKAARTRQAKFGESKLHPDTIKKMKKEGANVDDRTQIKSKK